jgi:hypothetical protein
MKESCNPGVVDNEQLKKHKQQETTSYLKLPVVEKGCRHVNVHTGTAASASSPELFGKQIEGLCGSS